MPARERCSAASRPFLNRTSAGGAHRGRGARRRAGLRSRRPTLARPRSAWRSQPPTPALHAPLQRGLVEAAGSRVARSLRSLDRREAARAQVGRQDTPLPLNPPRRARRQMDVARAARRVCPTWAKLRVVERRAVVQQLELEAGPRDSRHARHLTARQPGPLPRTDHRGEPRFPVAASRDWSLMGVASFGYVVGRLSGRRLGFGNARWLRGRLPARRHGSRYFRALPLPGPRRVPLLPRSVSKYSSGGVVILGYGFRDPVGC